MREQAAIVSGSLGRKQSKRIPAGRNSLRPSANQVRPQHMGPRTDRGRPLPLGKPAGPRLEGGFAAYLLDFQGTTVILNHCHLSPTQLERRLHFFIAKKENVCIAGLEKVE